MNLGCQKGCAGMMLRRTQNGQFEVVRCDEWRASQVHEDGGDALPRRFSGRELNLSWKKSWCASYFWPSS